MLYLMNPKMIRTPGGWLAITPEAYPLRIGVVAANELDARSRFDAAVTAWERLADMHEPARDQ